MSPAPIHQNRRMRLKPVRGPESVSDTRFGQGESVPPHYTHLLTQSVGRSLHILLFSHPLSIVFWLQRSLASIMNKSVHLRLIVVQALRFLSTGIPGDWAM
jgi:hypothetical protein